jgi:hypothetical protein
MVIPVIYWMERWYFKMMLLMNRVIGKATRMSLPMLRLDQLYLVSSNTHRGERPGHTDVCLFEGKASSRDG